MRHIDQATNTSIEVPSNLLTLPAKFYLTLEDMMVPGETSMRYIAESVRAGDDTYREHYEWLLLVMKRLMEEDVVQHVMTTPRGATIYEGVGASRRPVTKTGSRWRMPVYMKSTAEGAADAPPDIWFQWIEENFFAVLPYLEATPTTESEAHTLKKETIEKRLNPSNPKRKASLGWIAELKEQYKDRFSFLKPAKVGKSKEDK